MVTARGRDLRTDADGRAGVIEAARFDAQVDFTTGSLTAIRAEPPDGALVALVGISAHRGFRRAARSTMPDDVAARSVRFQLLDDLPIALLLSGRVLRVAGRRLGAPGRRLPVDICAGWAAGGSLLEGLTDLGPPLHVGPPASPLAREDDPLAWHEHDRLPPDSTRRCRRIDVWHDDGLGRVDCYFRDTHSDGSGVETVVHEYAVSAAVDPLNAAFVACDAEPGPLPYPECPAAAASAGQIVGRPVGEARLWVRESLTGPMTCTHLNDALRSLEGVEALLATVEQRG